MKARSSAVCHEEAKALRCGHVIPLKDLQHGAAAFPEDVASRGQNQPAIINACANPA